MPRGPTRPRPEPKRSRARRSGGNKSGRRARRRGGSGGGSAGNSGTRSTGYASSRDSLPQRPRSTRRRKRERWDPVPPSLRAIEAVEEQAPRRRAVYGRSGAHRGSTNTCLGGVWECRGGGDRCHSSVRRTLEEEAVRILRLEVSGRSSRRSGFEGLALSLCFRVRRVAPNVPALAPPKCLGRMRTYPRGGARRGHHGPPGA
jgi:hypothetical protein